MNTQDSPSSSAHAATHWPGIAVLTLGLGGLIPFVALALWAWIHPGTETAQKALVIQHAYAACILSFVGALHWAGAPAGQSRATEETGLLAAPAWRLMWGVTPSLVAWLAWVVPAEAQRGIWLAGGLGMALVFDLFTRAYWGWSRGFVYLRIVLSSVAILSLVATSLR